MKKLLLLAAIGCMGATNMQAEEPVGWHVSRYIWGGAGFVAGDIIRRKAGSKALKHAKALKNIDIRLIDESGNQDLLRAREHHKKWRAVWDVIAITGLVGETAGGYTVAQALWDRAVVTRDKKQHNKSQFVQEADLANARHKAHGRHMWVIPVPREQYLDHVQHRHEDIYDHYARMGKQLERSKVSQIFNPFMSFKDADEKKAAARKYLDHIKLYEEKYNMRAG